MSKVLIIEDDELVATIYRNKLSLEGYEVETACDGLAGLETVRSFRPDAVILDLMLPKLSGLELMATLRAEPEFKELPIIVFSNTYLSSTVQKAWNAGATKCLSKANCSLRQVLEVVRGTLTPGQNGSATGPKTPLAPAPTAPPAPAKSAEAVQPDPRQAILAGLPATLATLRSLLPGLIKADNNGLRLKQLQELYQQLCPLTSRAVVTGLARIAQMAAALEALLKELQEKPENLNASTLRTIAAAVDVLGQLSAQSGLPEPQHRPTPGILVVDDEIISRRAITFALEKAQLKSVPIEDPQMAYQLLSEHTFDLIFLDVDMPGMTGFELCAKLRKLAAHQNTPVVFVTSLNDLESRAHSTLSG
ncbi:MAG TPA: response regulator, partial [Bacillota bacterium]|nr:response regulator [Bacillota bacterium]